jgi:hypothetical protein
LDAHLAHHEAPANPVAPWHGGRNEGSDLGRLGGIYPHHRERVGRPGGKLDDALDRPARWDLQRSGTFTGPYGGVWRHSGNAHQVAPGQWAGEGSIVGPGGGRWQHSWTWHNGGS